MSYTIVELHQALRNLGVPVTPDLTKFRHMVWAMTKARQIKPPVKGSRTDGKPGLIGYYSEETIDKIAEILRRRLPGLTSSW